MAKFLVIALVVLALSVCLVEASDKPKASRSAARTTGSRTSTKLTGATRRSAPQHAKVKSVSNRKKAPSAAPKRSAPLANYLPISHTKAQVVMRRSIAKVTRHIDAQIDGNTALFDKQSAMVHKALHKLSAKNKKWRRAQKRAKTTQFRNKATVSEQRANIVTFDRLIGQLNTVIAGGSPKVVQAAVLTAVRATVSQHDGDLKAHSFVESAPATPNAAKESEAEAAHSVKDSSAKLAKAVARVQAAQEARDLAFAAENARNLRRLNFLKQLANKTILNAKSRAGAAATRYERLREARHTLRTLRKVLKAVYLSAAKSLATKVDFLNKQKAAMNKSATQIKLGALVVSKSH